MYNIKFEVTLDGEKTMVPLEMVPLRADGTRIQALLSTITQGVYDVDTAAETAYMSEFVLMEKWDLIKDFERTQTVTIGSNKYAVNPTSLDRIMRKEKAMLADAADTWYEEWGSFSTNKVELQEVISQADIDLQAFIDATMGA